MLEPYGIKEIAQSGLLAIGRGSKSHHRARLQELTTRVTTPPNNEGTKQWQQNSSMTRTPTSPSSRARRSPSSATARRATPTRRTSATRGVEVKIGLKDGSKSTAKATEEGFEVLTVADAAEWADVIMILAPDQHQRSIYSEQHQGQAEAGQDAGLRARLQHPLRLHRRPRGRRRDPHRPEGPGPHGASRVRRGPRHPGHHRGRARRLGPRLGPRPLVREGDRRHPRRRHQDDLHRGDRDRPVRRAVGALRRHLAARAVRLRDPRRGRLPARDRLLRGAARAQAHRRPHVGGRHRQAALERQRHRRVRRLRLAARASSTRASRRT